MTNPKEKECGCVTRECEDRYIENHECLPDHYEHKMCQKHQEEFEEWRKEKRETLEIPQARPAGKMTKLLREFYASGMKGEASVLATSQGKFCTPEMVKKLIKQAFEETRGEMREIPTRS